MKEDKTLSSIVIPKSNSFYIFFINSDSKIDS